MSKFNFDSEALKTKQDEIKSVLAEHEPKIDAVKKAMGIFESLQQGDLPEAMKSFTENQEIFSMLQQSSKGATNQRLDMVEADKQYNFTIEETIEYFKTLQEDTRAFIISQCK